MNAFKNLFAGLLIAATTILPIAAPTAVQATPPAQTQDTVYYVYVRADVYSPWLLYGTYTCPNQAQQAINYLHNSGYEYYCRW